MKQLLLLVRQLARALVRQLARALVRQLARALLCRQQARRFSQRQQARRFRQRQQARLLARALVRQQARARALVRPRVCRLQQLTQMGQLQILTSLLCAKMFLRNSSYPPNKG